MARLLAVFSTAEIAAAVGANKTMLQILAPANHRVVVKRVGVYFDGISPTEQPIEIMAARQTTVGGGSSGCTPVKLDNSLAETIQTSGIMGCTSEPTTTDIVEVCEAHPQQSYEWIYPLTEEIVVAGGTRLGIIVKAPQAVNCRTKLVIEE